MHSYQVSVDAYKTAWFLGTAIAFLLAASMAGQVFRHEVGPHPLDGLVPLFDVDSERNIPTFFTVILALYSALLLAVIAAGSKDRRERFHWRLLCAGFVFIAYDEAFQVHERLIAPMRELLGNKDLGYLYFGWVVPGIAGVCIVALFFLGFLRRLPAATRRRMLAAGGLYVAGCLGMELIDGKYLEAHGYTLFYSFLTTIEEGLEMTGLAALVYALLGHIASNSGKVEFHVSAGMRMQAMPVAQVE
ncbi:hypothetical protein [Massilia consociata]|uniref:Multidrug transporter n=1 Tax=Massilia consociata TaxID=760117 RepID=A0ABV6FIM7_9BURK